MAISIQLYLDYHCLMSHVQHSLDDSRRFCVFCPIRVSRRPSFGQYPSSRQSKSGLLCCCWSNPTLHQKKVTASRPKCHCALSWSDWSLNAPATKKIWFPRNEKSHKRAIVLLTDWPTGPPSSLRRHILKRRSENHFWEGDVYGMAVTIAHAHSTCACRRVAATTGPRWLVNLL